MPDRFYPPHTPANRPCLPGVLPSNKKPPAGVDFWKKDCYNNSVSGEKIFPGAFKMHIFSKTALLKAQSQEGSAPGLFVSEIKLDNFSFFIPPLFRAFPYDFWPRYRKINTMSKPSGCGSVGRAGGLGPSGRTFESCHSDQNADLTVILRSNQRKWNSSHRRWGVVTLGDRKSERICRPHTGSSVECARSLLCNGRVFLYFKRFSWWKIQK